MSWNKRFGVWQIAKRTNPTRINNTNIWKGDFIAKYSSVGVKTNYRPHKFNNIAIQ